MIRFALLTGAGVLACGSALADVCPAAPDHTRATNALIDSLKAAKSEAEAAPLSLELWRYWAQAPDAYAQELLDEGMSRRAAFDYDGAMIALDALVEYCPDYAEGYNQRAFVNFLRREYEAALPDLARALDLSPRHIAALTGQALTLAALGRNGPAAVALRKALKMNPWLSERHLLPSLEAQEQEL